MVDGRGGGEWEENQNRRKILYLIAQVFKTHRSRGGLELLGGQKLGPVVHRVICEGNAVQGE